ncbi:Uncharacterised protein [uncultured archaeon]|nr:Uncharacterised protein [uncultured archaeon]
MLSGMLINMKNITCAMGEFVWSPRAGIDVSSHGRPPYNLFSPFSHNAYYQIPVPGQEQLRADSVEGIWQGLKIINGQTNPSLFKGRPCKCKGKPEGHQFGNSILGYEEARRQIYVPAYIYHAVNNALPAAWADLERRLQGGDVGLHDVEQNGSITDLTRPLAHSAILVHLLNVIKEAPIPKKPVRQPNPEKSRFTYLHEQVNALVDYYNTLSFEDRHILDEVITFAYLFSPDTKKQSFALEVIKQAGIDTDRVDKYHHLRR